MASTLVYAERYLGPVGHTVAMTVDELVASARNVVCDASARQERSEVKLPKLQKLNGDLTTYDATMGGQSAAQVKAVYLYPRAEHASISDLRERGNAHEAAGVAHFKASRAERSLQTARQLLNDVRYQYAAADTATAAEQAAANRLAADASAAQHATSIARVHRPLLWRHVNDLVRNTAYLRESGRPEILRPERTGAPASIKQLQPSQRGGRGALTDEDLDEACASTSTSTRGVGNAAAHGDRGLDEQRAELATCWGTPEFEGLLRRVAYAQAPLDDAPRAGSPQGTPGPRELEWQTSLRAHAQTAAAAATTVAQQAVALQATAAQQAAAEAAARAAALADAEAAVAEAQTAADVAWAHADRASEAARAARS